MKVYKIIKSEQVAPRYINKYGCKNGGKGSGKGDDKGTGKGDSGTEDVLYCSTFNHPKTYQKIPPRMRRVYGYHHRTRISRRNFNRLIK